MALIYPAINNPHSCQQNQKPQAVLIVFDFDHTLINVNSDLVLFQTLPYAVGFFPRFRVLKEEGMGWTELMREQLKAVANCDGYSRDGVIGCLRSVRMDEGLVDVLREISRKFGMERRKDEDAAKGEIGSGKVRKDEERGREEEEKGGRGMKNIRPDATRMGVMDVKMVVASDANTLFINEILKANNLDNEVFDAVYTNPAKWTTASVSAPEESSNTRKQQDVIHVEPYASLSSPHNCARCSANMCKTDIVQRAKRELLGLDGEGDETPLVRTVYVGDGHNDFCPCLSLSVNDVVLPRKGYALEKMIAEAEINAAAAVTNESVHEPIEDEPAEGQAALTTDSRERQAVQTTNRMTSERFETVTAEVKLWQTQAELGEMLWRIILEHIDKHTADDDGSEGWRHLDETSKQLEGDEVVEALRNRIEKVVKF